jgi:two-component system, OmpR family, sensor kinase
MTGMRVALRQLWRRFLPRARISIRIVTAVVLAMSLVLLVAGAFVYWRISYALDRQLNQDLAAYTNVVRATVAAGNPLPQDDPGLVAQTYTLDGDILTKSDPGVRNLLNAAAVRAAGSTPQTLNIGRLIPPPSENPYRVRYQLTGTADGNIVVATAISRHKHDEALRELLLQLAIADLATVLAAGIVGWGATRAALGPVERYRKAAASAGGDPSTRLPVESGADDELARLGNTFNALLADLDAGRSRERQFLANASHELRSPLAVLAAEVEWARHRQRTTQELDQVLDSIAGQTQHLASLADALLNLEEANESERNFIDSVSVAVLIESAIQPHRATARDLGRTIQVATGDETVEVEVRWVELAVSNLLANALRHGQGDVAVRTTVQDDFLTVDVIDQGPGIPEPLGEAAFDRFARAEGSRTTPGHGLGLAIVAAVAQRHLGTVALIPGGVRLRLQSRGR